MILIAISIPVVLFSLWMLSGYLPTRNIAMPAYTVTASHPEYEIREYETYIIAETQQERGFNELLQYISGNNTAQTKLSMTAPVLKSEGVAGLKLNMTAPVLKKKGEGLGSIAFVMPPGYSLAELPIPKNPKISLREILGHRVATVTFSGYASAEIIEEKTAELLRGLMRDGIHVISKPTTALYNPPWTPPFMRKNEILVDIE